MYTKQSSTINYFFTTVFFAFSNSFYIFVSHHRFILEDCLWTQHNIYKIVPRTSEYSIDVDGRGKLKNNFNLPSRSKKKK